MQARTFTGRLAQAIHAYPSTSIGIQQTAAQLFAEGRLLAPVEDDVAPSQTQPNTATAQTATLP